MPQKIFAQLSGKLAILTLSLARSGNHFQANDLAQNFLFVETQTLKTRIYYLETLINA